MCPPRALRSLWLCLNVGRQWPSSDLVWLKCGRKDPLMDRDKENRQGRLVGQDPEPLGECRQANR